MDVMVPGCDVEGHTPRREVFGKTGGREIGQKGWKDKLKCIDQEILTDIGLYQPVRLGPPISMSAGLQFRKGIG